MFTASLQCLFPSFIPSIWPFCIGSCYCKKQIDINFYASVLLLMINFVITLSKFTAEPLACSLWFHSHFLWQCYGANYLSSIRGQMHEKTDVNVASWKHNIVIIKLFLFVIYYFLDIISHSALIYRFSQVQKRSSWARLFKARLR